MSNKHTKVLQDTLLYLEAQNLATNLQEEIRRALSQEPDYWIVIDPENYNESVYCASHKQFCIDHISDALLYGAEDAGLWVIRPAWIGDRRG